MLTLLALRALLAPGLDQLPGRDSGSLYVWELFTRSALRAGLLPHWNPFHFAGTPHLADPQTTVLYPPAMLLRLLPPLEFLPWMALVHVWFGGVGALFLGRVVGLGWIAATASAVAVMLGGSIAPWVHNGHLLLLYCSAWLPWAMALSIVSVRRLTVWPHPMLVVVLVLQFLAGYVQGSIYVVAAVSLYFLFSALWPDGMSDRRARFRPIAQLAILGVLTVGVSAFQLLPTTRLVAEAGRGTGLRFDEAIEGTWSLRHLATFFFPFYGAPSSTTHRDLSDAMAYTGWLMTVMAPLAFLDRSRARLAMFFGVLAAGAVAMASPELPLYRLHYAVFPGFRVPGRILFLATLGLAMLGGLGLESFIARARSRQWRPLLWGVAVSVVAAVAALIVVSASTRGAPAEPGWPWLPVVAMAGMVLIAVLASRSFRRAALVAGLTLVAVDMMTFTTGAVSLVPVEPTALVKGWMGPADGGRGISMCENRIGPSEMLLNGQAALDGPAGIFLDDYADWAYVARYGNPVPEDGLFHGMDSEGLLPARRDLVDLANVSVLFSCRQLTDPSLTLVSRRDSVYVYRNETEWPRAFWTCGGQMLSEAAATDRLLRSRYTREGRLVPETYVNVRWAGGVDEARRRTVEERYQLGEGVALDATTWRYVLGDASIANVIALIQDPAVEDTHGVDRATGVVVPTVLPASRASEAGDELVLGTLPCATRATVTVLTQDRPDGGFVADVNAPAMGFVFLSEPHYPERQAFVDGMPVRSVTANLAFTAVPVDAGHHRLELRYVPRSFYLGLGTSGTTLAAWCGLVFLGRARRPRTS